MPLLPCALAASWLLFVTRSDHSLKLLPSVYETSQFVSELLPHKAVNNRIQAAVGVRKAHGQREHICVHYVICFVPVCGVKFDQHAPQGDGMVWHPAEEEGQHDDGDRFCNLGSSFGVTCFHTPIADETQQHDVADGHDGHWQNETYKYFLYVIKC